MNQPQQLARIPGISVFSKLLFISSPRQHKQGNRSYPQEWHVTPTPNTPRPLQPVPEYNVFPNLQRQMYQNAFLS